MRKFAAFDERIVELSHKGLVRKKVHFVSRDCGSLQELDLAMNELTNTGYKIVEIMPMHSEFFASYNIIAVKELKKRKRKKAKKTKGWFLNGKV